MIVAHDADRRVARDRLAVQRRRLAYARLANQAMNLAVYYRKRWGLPMLPAGPAACIPGCPRCDWWAA
jgi:hypothetical protein